MDREGNSIKIGFQLVLSQELEESISSNQVEVVENTNTSKEKKEITLLKFDLVQK